MAIVFRYLVGLSCAFHA